MSLEASGVLARLSTSGVPRDARALGSDAGATPGGTHFTAETPKVSPDLGVLRNIATYHREHERYYTASLLGDSAELARDANRLKVIADVWLAASPSAEKSQIDYSDPLYQAAGCQDLNALHAIPLIGILFMEGEAEPAEIRTLKAMLRGRATGLCTAGRWLADKAEAAWRRESVLFEGELAPAAEPRFQTIVTNWLGAQTSALAGRLLSIAAEVLERIDFTPAGVRANQKSSGTQIRFAGWLLDLAAQLLARSGADLARNDLSWTEYQEIIERLTAARR